MFFILSKLLFFLLVPATWIIVILLWAWLTRSPRTRRKLIILAAVLAIVFTNPFIYRSMVHLWQPAYAYNIPANTTYDAGILLGGMSFYDKNNQGYFGDNADRFIQTANLYHKGVIKKILISGGTGNILQREPPEALFLKQQFMAIGVKEADIIVEGKSRNTYENAVFSKHIFDSLQLKPPFILVTSAIHMRRSEAIFNKAGIPFIAVPCDYKVVYERFKLEDYITPDVSLLKIWSFLIKEVVGLNVYRLTGKA